MHLVKGISIPHLLPCNILLYASCMTNLLYLPTLLLLSMVFSCILWLLWMEAMSTVIY